MYGRCNRAMRARGLHVSGDVYVQFVWCDAMRISYEQDERESVLRYVLDKDGISSPNVFV